jgi:hypothetical protein
LNSVVAKSLVGSRAIIGVGNIDNPRIGQPRAVPALVRLPAANHDDPPRLNDDFCPFHLCQRETVAVSNRPHYNAAQFVASDFRV